MEDQEFLDILESIEKLLLCRLKFEAKEYIKIEIDNLEGKVPEDCQNTLYYYNNCYKCNNKNCNKYLGKIKDNNNKK